ncbi:hypothetical protein PsorP6_012440 [Peronosclerospora sorghi]|uniref:Uncharacterized protein n=1 Tax=Peronosclerospora sorghi TaxID=230839 RepID=A0ACC0WGM0_9STRA|nr:hypothetical protein PsorP6_012440 [Peronosclerospora sorghi]
MEGQWRAEIPEDMRKKMITEMYHELARISGEMDKQKVWGSAAKFELMLWSSSPDRNSYLMKMQRKILSLKKKQGAGEIQQTTLVNTVGTSTSLPGGGAGGMNLNVNAATMNASMNLSQFQPNAAVAASQGMTTFQQQAPTQVQAQAPVQAQAQAQQVQATAVAAPTGGNLRVATSLNPTVSAGLNSTSAAAPPPGGGATPALGLASHPQQQAQQWLQRIQVQFQAQQRQILHTQNQETQQLRQQHMNQQQQLAQQQQQQGVAPELRRQQLQTLQQQHQLARTRLQHLHKSKQQQLQRKQQQYLLQKQHQLQQQQQGSMAAATQAAGGSATSLAVPNPTTGQTTTVPTSQASATLPPAPQAVKAEQLAAAHSQQAAMREMQRAQNAAQMHGDSALKHQVPVGSVAPATSTAPTGATGPAASSTGSSNQTYAERLKEMKQKYWDDLVIVYREFERMVKQKPANQQQERINTFLVNLKRIIALLQQDPAKVPSNNKNDLDRVEAHIHKQVLPILERLKHKTRAAAAGGTDAVAAQQDQLKKTQEAQRLVQLQQEQEQQHKMQEQQKAEAQRKLLEEQKKKLQLEAAAAAKNQEMLEQQRTQKQKQLQAQHAQQQALLQQQRQQLLAQQQAQLKAQTHVRMNATAPPPSAVASGSMGVATSAVPSTGNDVTPTSNVNGSDGASTTLGASLQAPLDVAAAGITTSITNGMASLTPAQYRTFKLPEARKQQLTAQHAKLREQQQELILQQSRAKSPSHQAKLAHQAQRLAQMINKISQQLVQCKLAEEYEQSKSLASSMSPPPADDLTSRKAEGAVSNPSAMGVNGLPPASRGVPGATTTSSTAGTNQVSGASAATAATAQGTAGHEDKSFQSVVPDLTGLSASEKLLTAVAAYEKHKPDVLKRGALRFSRIAVTIGAKLNTSYVTS